MKFILITELLCHIIIIANVIQLYDNHCDYIHHDMNYDNIHNNLNDVNVYLVDMDYKQVVDMNKVEVVEGVELW